MDYMTGYREWLTAFANDAETIQDLESIRADEKEIEDRFYRELEFGTAGMRGVLGAGKNRMNVYNVRRATKALAKYVLSFEGGAERGVVIAYDSRIKSDVFAREAALVLAASGVKAMLFESLRPVPVLSYSVRKTGAIAGIVITASHNPSRYNGYKVYWEDGGQMPPERAKEITARIAETSYDESLPMDWDKAIESGLLQIVGKELDDSYIADVKKLCVNPELARELGETLKIVYTPLHGSGNIPVRRIFDEIGMKNVFVVPEQELPDGNFPTVRVPNPEESDAFQLAVAMQKELGADLCVGTDPDCDRVGVACLTADGSVRLLNGNQIGCVLLHYILSQKAKRGELPANAAAVKSIVSTEMARAICKDFGVELVDVLTGFKFIAEQIHLYETTGKHTFMFGFEESFGFLSGTDVRDKDGVNACMLIAEAAAYYKTKGKTLVDGVDELYEKYGYYGDKVVSVTLPGKDGLDKMQKLMATLRTQPPKAFAGMEVSALRDYQAGTRTLSCGCVEKLTLPASNVLYFELKDGGWICVRPSGTEPKIKLYVNAVSDSADKTKALLEAYAQAAKDAMEEAGK